MSGGFLNPQKEGEHQIVTFTFIGRIDPGRVKKWNANLAKIKKLFKNNLVGITVRGDPTPDEFRPSRPKKKR
jgi:hypothetical protein